MYIATILFTFYTRVCDVTCYVMPWQYHRVKQHVTRRLWKLNRVAYIYNASNYPVRVTTHREMLFSCATEFRRVGYRSTISFILCMRARFTDTVTRASKYKFLKLLVNQDRDLELAFYNNYNAMACTYMLNVTSMR